MMYRVLPLRWRAGIVLLVLGLLAATAVRAEPAKELRIGFQKYGTLTLVKGHGNLEGRLAAQGVTVRWIEFAAGPQLLEALNVGSVDIGVAGEAPPVFAQAAGAPLVYVGYEPASPSSEAILVPKDSPIRSVAELKGKRVALNKGSNVHYLLVRALAAAGLGVHDIQPVYLPPGDARVAFEQGAVDAWAIWDPFLADAQRATQARQLTDGTGLVANHQFYLANRTFAKNNPAIIKAILAEIESVSAWAQRDPGGAAQVLAPLTGIEVHALETSIGRMGLGVQPLDSSVAAEQQRIADSFFELGLIPRKIEIREALPAPGT